MFAISEKAFRAARCERCLRRALVAMVALCSFVNLWARYNSTSDLINAILSGSRGIPTVEIVFQSRAFSLVSIFSRRTEFRFFDQKEALIFSKNVFLREQGRG